MRDDDAPAGKATDETGTPNDAVDPSIDQSTTTSPPENDVDAHRYRLGSPEDAQADVEAHGRPILWPDPAD